MSLRAQSILSHRTRRPGKPPMKVLVVDVGGTHVKILATGQREHRRFVSGPNLTAEQMVTEVKALAERWKYDVVSIGYPGPVLNRRPVAEPTIWAGAGSGSTIAPHSGARSGLSTMQPCRHWVAIRVEKCSFLAWEPVLVRP